MASTVVLPSSARVTQLKRHNLEANETILFFFSFIHFIRWENFGGIKCLPKFKSHIKITTSKIVVVCLMRQWCKLLGQVYNFILGTKGA